MGKSGELPILLFSTQEEFEHWLEHNHASAPGVFVHIAKKGSDTATVSYAEALESALCYGWIDSRKEKYDANTWLQRLTDSEQFRVFEAAHAASHSAVLE
ncbi:YdeI/OmpD-associated family protein [Marinicrinis lubricantis]|uniref:YdeI/OmpD-associated family protein n=1 Tax=Marinicrinis lubricantis TaxID=2086470 RepID=UPI0039EEB601